MQLSLLHEGTSILFPLLQRLGDCAEAEVVEVLVVVKVYCSVIVAKVSEV